MMQPPIPLKTRLCRSIFSTVRNYSTCVANVQSIVSWQRAMGYEVYRSFPSLTVVIGERDSSLDKRSMLISANGADSEQRCIYSANPKPQPLYQPGIAEYDKGYSLRGFQKGRLRV